MITELVNWPIFLGRLHPLVVHLPIGIIIISCIVYWISGSHKQQSYIHIVLRYLLFVNAIAAVLSVIFGLLLIREDAYTASGINLHKWTGIGTAILSCLAWIIFSLNQSGKRLRQVSMWLLFISILVTGHFGGMITHGKQYLSQYAPGILKPILGGSPLEITDYHIPLSEMDSTNIFQDMVFPILDSKCSSCHNPDKMNGGLSMHTFEAIVQGGNSGSVLHVDPLESSLFSRTTLPQNSEKFMPPQGIPLTYKEQRVVAYWLEMGHPENAFLKDIDLPEPLLVIMEELFGYVAQELSFVETHEIQKADSTILSEINLADFHCQPIAASTHFLEAYPKADVKELSQAQLEILLPIQDQLSWLSLPKQNIQDEDLEVLQSFQNLSKLKLQQNPITDQGIQHIRQLKNLEVLNLYQTEITNQSIESLSALSNLKALYIWNTKIDSAGVDQLKGALPNTEIISGH